MNDERSLYDGLVQVMERYLSHATVTGTLRVVMKNVGVTGDHLQPRDLEAVVSESMVGLRIFCDPETLPELMLELADYCETHGEG